MTDELRLRIITPRRPVLDEVVLEVTAPGTLGEFGVLPNHVTFLSSLEIGRLSYRDGRGLHHLAVRDGFAEVSNNVMTVLVEDAESGTDVDPGRAQAELTAAETRLAQRSPYDPEYAALDADRRWALARLEAARK